VANAVGGLFGARLLSLAFMLAATVLLYSAASRLFDRKTGAFAAALWAVHAPTIQLGAFATYDAMSVSLTALAGWLVVQAGFRRHRGELVAASAVALAAANLAAFSGVVMDPLVLVFALLAWNALMGLRQALYCTGWFILTFLASFAGTMTLTRAWPAIMADVFSRAVKTGARATPLHVFQDSWTYTGLIIVLAAVGAVAAMSAESRARGLLVSSLAVAALLVPLAQAHDSTAVSLQKHLAYGAWFAAIAAGYGCRRLTQQVSLGSAAVAFACALALVYPTVNGWWSAWHWYHTWPNSTSLVAAENAVLPQVKGEMYVSSTDSDAAYFLTGYYLKQNLALKVIANGTPSVTLLKQTGLGAVVLFFPASDSDAEKISEEISASARDPAVRKKLVSYLDSSSNDGKQLADVTVALDTGAKFRLANVGQYDDSSSDSVYAIWLRT
jgi:hypothetical protein